MFGDENTAGTVVLETDRLILRRFTEDDTAFILELLNDPMWLRFIGNRGVRTAEDARGYLVNAPLAMYARSGFGLWRVDRKEGGGPIGMCGLIERDGLGDVDIGFAFLERFRGMGYAFEAAAATMRHGRGALGLGRIIAYVSPDNHASIRVLEKLGLRFEKTTILPGETEELSLYSPPGETGAPGW